MFLSQFDVSDRICIFYEVLFFLHIELYKCNHFTFIYGQIEGKTNLILFLHLRRSIPKKAAKRSIMLMF